MTNYTPRPIGPDDPFRFCCSPAVSCFNACCRDLNQFLTPYDIVRLKSHLNLISPEFLARHTRWHVGPQTGLPIVSLKEAEPVHRTCRFLEAGGCGVYPHRPSSCRIYPLIRMVGFDPGTHQRTETFLLLQEPHCKGFSQVTEQTANTWIGAQGLTEYNHFNDQLVGLISRKRRLRPGPLSDHERRRAFMALYDLDALRVHIRENGKLEGIEIDPATLNQAMSDDLTLLRLGTRWLEATLFDPKNIGTRGTQHKKISDIEQKSAE